MNFTQKLDRRRRELGITFEALANLSGVPVSTLKNIFKNGVEHSTFSRVMAVATVLGVQIENSPEVDTYELKHQQAVRKAKKLVGLVQGTSALEAQAVADEQLENMIRQLVHELMAGSPRTLWAA
jgi:transcriptional regulator with XRE-family HTH domain